MSIAVSGATAKGAPLPIIVNSDDIEPDTSAAVAYLRDFDRTGAHNLVAIDPNAVAPTGHTFGVGQWDEIATWIEKRRLTRNLYYSVNEPLPGAPHNKLQKHHIGALRALHVDLDPNPRAESEPGGLEAERKRLARITEEAQSDPLNPPTFVIDSGGGMQMLWLLSEPLEATADNIEWVEGMNRALAARFSGDTTVWNIDRVLRLPGTVNLPDAGKRARGRKPALAKLMFSSSEGAISRADLEAAFGPPLPANKTSTSDAEIAAVQTKIDIGAVREASTYDDLPSDLRSRFERLRADNPTVDRLWKGDRKARPGDDASGSGFAFALGAAVRRSGNFTPAELGQLLFVWEYASKPVDKIDERYIARAWLNSNAASAEEEFEPVEVETDEPLLPVVNIADHVWTADQRYVVKGLLAPGNIALLTGEPNSGKSPIAFDLAASIAKGIPWCGMRVKQGYVLHFSTEGAGGMANRIEAQKRHHFPAGAERPPLDTYQGRLDLRSLKHVQLLIRTIEGRAAAFDVPPALLVIDTLSHAIAGSDADDEVAREIIANLHRIVGKTGVAILACHHPTKGNSSSYRGSSLWSFDTDLQINLKRNEKTGHGEITNPRPKDFEQMKPRHYGLRQVHLGDDLEGDALTSIVVEWHADPETEFGDILPTRETEMLRALKRAALASGGADPSTYDTDQKCDKADITPAIGRLEFSTSEWKTAYQPRQTHGRSVSTFCRTANRLAELGCVTRIDAPKGKQTLWKLPVRQTASNHVTTH